MYWAGRETTCVGGSGSRTGEPITVGYVNEYDPQAIIRWLRPLVQRHGISVIVTDDLSSYKIVTERLQLGHQICQFHVRRWMGKTLKDLQETIPKEWLWVVEEVRQLLDVLHREGSQRLHALWKQLPGRCSRHDKTRSAMEQLRDLLLRLSRDWHTYCTFQSEPEVPWTNNATERAIGRMKMRARTVRGYKSWQGMESGSDVGWNLHSLTSIPAYKAFCFPFQFHHRYVTEQVSIEKKHANR